MKKSYCTPELEVEAFNIFTVFTESSTGGGQNPGGGAIDPDADICLLYTSDAADE